MVQPAWSYKAKGVIWRLIPMDSGIFVGEVRDIESKQTSFVCLDRQSGNVLWEGVTFNERWWIGIEATHRDRLFLHGFATPDMPGHKGIIAVDVATGRVAWEKPELRFILSSDDSVFASSEMPEGLMVHELNSRTGETLTTWNNRSEPLEAARDRAIVQTVDGQIFPQPLEFHSDDSMRNVLRKHCSMENVVGSIEVLVVNGHLVFSYHERENEETGSTVLLRNVLGVVNVASGNLEFTTTLITGIPSAARDSFFVIRDMLYSIKDRSTIVALRINDLRK